MRGLKLSRFAPSSRPVPPPPAAPGEIGRAHV